MVAATDLPVNADFEGGFAHDPAGVAESVRLAVETGVAGLSIEDSTGDKAKPLYDFDNAVARIRAARQAIDRAGGDTLLVGRSEGFVAGTPDLDETIRRLKAYAAAGADCLYAPGIKTREDRSGGCAEAGQLGDRQADRAHRRRGRSARGTAHQPRLRRPPAKNLGVKFFRQPGERF